jgi:hypothetical protein
MWNVHCKCASYREERTNADINATVNVRTLVNLRATREERRFSAA